MSRKADRHRHHHHHGGDHRGKTSYDHAMSRKQPMYPSGSGGAPSNLDYVLVQTLNLSRLQHLSLRNLGPFVLKRTMLNSLLKNFTCLKYLDISNCCTNQLYIERRVTTCIESSSNNGSGGGVGIGVGVGQGEMARMSLQMVSSPTTGDNLNEPQPQASMNQPNEKVGCLDGLANLANSLTHLLMADLNVDDVQANLKFILKLKSLKHLDVSNCREKPPLNR